MQKDKKFQWKFLQKEIDACELSNGLTHNFENLELRDIRFSCQKLADADVVLPWSLRAQVSSKMLSAALSEILDCKDKDEDVDKSISKVVAILSCWKHTTAEDTDAWTLDNPSFDVLAKELIVDEAEELSKEREAELEAANQDCGAFAAVLLFRCLFALPCQSQRV